MDEDYFDGDDAGEEDQETPRGLRLHIDDLPAFENDYKDFIIELFTFLNECQISRVPHNLNDDSDAHN